MSGQEDAPPVPKSPALPAASAPVLDEATARRRTRLLFTATVFVSAFLLFLIQPLFGRKVLPLLGGAPGVWNTAMVFYQALLLIGYCYAHAARRLPARIQLMVHVTFLALAAATLPISVASWYPEPGNSSPFLWLIGLFTVSIGLPFLAVSTHAPLLQRWFAGSGDPDAANPYFLYAASNLGSMLALIAYPLLFEPLLALAEQAAVWSAGFVLLALLVAACGWGLLRQTAGPATVMASVEPAPAWPLRLRWVLLAAVPSGLLLAVTTMITTDIMAMPLLWMIPLILYLLTFVIAFSEKPLLKHATMIALAPGALMAAALFAMTGATTVALLLLVLALVCFFLVTLACHGELVATRPGAAHLTEFYIWMSLGGVIGGLFTALAAPALLTGVYEYPILLLAAALVLPAGPRAQAVTARFGGQRTPPWLWDMLMPVAALGLSARVAASQLAASEGSGLDAPGAICLALLLTATMLSRGRRYRFAVHLLACILAYGGWVRIWGQDNVRFQDRSFFGVYAVKDYAGIKIRVLSHGTTAHGAQSMIPALKHEPQTYYTRQSGVGQVLAAAPQLFPNARIGAIGLGSGTIGCYARPGQQWSFFEIDPLVVRIARDPALFSYIPDCARHARMVVGDARLTLAREAPAAFDVLVVDAFSSDSIPLHLITREAIELYAARIKRSGVVMLHISNRHLDLEPVVDRAARAAGLSARSLSVAPPANPDGMFRTPSRWIAIAHDPAVLQTVLDQTPAGAADWTPLRAEPGRVWTDDYANLLSALSATGSH